MDDWPGAINQRRAFSFRALVTPARPDQEANWRLGNFVRKKRRRGRFAGERPYTDAVDNLGAGLRVGRRSHCPAARRRRFTPPSTGGTFLACQGCDCGTDCAPGTQPVRANSRWMLTGPVHQRRAFSCVALRAPRRAVARRTHVVCSRQTPGIANLPSGRHGLCLALLRRLHARGPGFFGVV